MRPCRPTGRTCMHCVYVVNTFCVEIRRRKKEKKKKLGVEEEEDEIEEGIGERVNER